MGRSSGWLQSGWQVTALPATHMLSSISSAATCKTPLARHFLERTWQ